MKIHEIESPNNTELQQGTKQGIHQFEWEEDSPAFQKFLSDCSDALNVYTKMRRFLFRGIKNSPGNIFIGRSRDNRNPRDLSPMLQTRFDNALKDVGINVLRSTSIFCTADTELAEQYGEIYSIIPVNGFKFAYSPEVRDFQLLLENNYINDFGVIDISDEQLLDIADTYLDTNFGNALEPYSVENAYARPNEVMIQGTYYALSWSNTTGLAQYLRSQ